MQVENKKILVTGAGSGIGRALSLELIKKGAKVIGVDLSQENLDETKKLGGDKFEGRILNVADREGIEALTKEVEIDGLVNNAGIIQPFVKVNDLEEKDIERVMQVNFYGVINMVKAFLPGLLKRPEAHIVNVSSMGGFLPVPGQSVYGASKAAVKLLTEGLYAELKNTKVGVTVVFPGATKTNIAKNSGIKIDTGEEEQDFPALPAEEAAKLIIEGIEKNKFQVYTGKDSKMMNLLYRLSPKRATDFITKKMGSLLK